MNVTQAVLSSALREMDTVLASLEMAIMVTPTGTPRDRISVLNIKAMELRDSLKGQCEMAAAESDPMKKPEDPFLSL